jgi:hypothetical protein
MYVAYLGGLVVVVVGFFSMGVIGMAVLTVWCTRRSTGQLVVMLVVRRLLGCPLAVVPPIAAWVPMRTFPNLRQR